MMKDNPESNTKEPPPNQVNHWTDFARDVLWRGKIGPAFWTVTGALSLVVSIALLVVLILFGRQLFALKSLVSDQLIGGLYYNFVLMDKAHITTDIQVSDTIQVDDSIPVVFDVPLSTKTTVVLTQDTPIENATIYLNGMPVPLDLTLREGTPLSIKLDLTVPVSKTVPVVLNVPVNLNVPVDIPLSETELHDPFIGLQSVVSPYYWRLVDLPDVWQDIPYCQDNYETACRWLLSSSPTK
jgi:hypothetical protein